MCTKLGTKDKNKGAFKTNSISHIRLGRSAEFSISQLLHVLIDIITQIYHIFENNNYINAKYKF